MIEDRHTNPIQVEYDAEGAESLPYGLEIEVLECDAPNFLLGPRLVLADELHAHLVLNPFKVIVECLRRLGRGEYSMTLL